MHCFQIRAENIQVADGMCAVLSVHEAVIGAFAQVSICIQYTKARNKIMNSSRRISLSLLFVVGFSMLLSSEAFAPVASMARSTSTSQFATIQVEACVPSSSIDIAAGIDPTTLFSDLLTGLIGSNAILAVPIVAALGVASLLAWLIVSYANPQVEDDEI
jgi:hypothetical protein